MKIQALKRLISDFQAQKPFDAKPRDFSLALDTGKIITLAGVRRCGKTSIFYEAINGLCKAGKKKQVIFINFEDERLDLAASELGLILDAYLQLYPKQDLSQCYFFFDEIQNILGWEKFVRRLYDTVSKKVFITGSNSKLLSSEIASSLRGRTLDFHIYPLSFVEFLRFRGLLADLKSSQNLALIQNAQDEFLRTSSFPEACFLPPRLLTNLLQNYFQTLMCKDLQERYQVKNQLALKYFLKRIAASNAKQLSIHKIYNELKSLGIKIGKDALYDFLEHAQSTGFSHLLPKYGNGAASKEWSEKKIYATDWGLASCLDFEENLGKNLENAVYMELLKRGEEPCYYKDARGECDFLLMRNERVYGALQVCWGLNDDNLKRELAGALLVARSFELKSVLIITAHSRQKLEVGGVCVEVLPFFDWLLG